MSALNIALFVVAAIALAVGFWFSFVSLRAWRRSLADLAEARRSGAESLDLLAKAQHHHDEAKRHHQIARQVHERAEDILRRAREATGSFPVTGVEVDTPPEGREVAFHIRRQEGRPGRREVCFCSIGRDHTDDPQTEDERRQQRRRHLTARANKEK